MKSLAFAERHGLTRYVAHQAYYSLVGRDYEWELMPLGARPGVGAVVWSPLGWARLTGKIRRGQPAPAVSRLQRQDERRCRPPLSKTSTCYTVVDAIDAIAPETGKTVPQIALNWLLQRPTVSTLIIGARNEEQLRQNLGAVGWNLTTRAGGAARRRQRGDAAVSVLAPARLRRAQSAARVSGRNFGWSVARPLVVVIGCTTEPWPRTTEQPRSIQ